MLYVFRALFDVTRLYLAKYRMPCSCKAGQFDYV